MIDKNWQRRFIFVACQPDSQEVCKREIAARYPELRFSFSKPGFLTFKLPEDHRWPVAFDLKSTFARTYGWCIGQVDMKCDDGVRQLLQSSLGESFEPTYLHRWTSKTSADDEESDALNEKTEMARQLTSIGIEQGLAKTDQWVLDVIQTGSDQFWLGVHLANQIFQRWPGGIPIIDRPEVMISRAYLKTAEALLWSRLPISKSDTCVEIGSAPGGSCQRLLELGTNVIAIDPADLDPAITEHAGLRHIKKRGRDVRHNEIAHAKWLLVDSNVAPVHTLDTVEAIVQGKKVHVRGMLLTLKMLDWDLADQIPEFIERVKAWGFGFVKTRQLAFGRREVCLLALKHRGTRRFGRVRN